MKFTGKNNKTVLHVEHGRLVIPARRSFSESRLVVLLFFVVLIHLQSCTKPAEQKQVLSSTNIKYAKGFTVKQEGNATWVTVSQPYNEASARFTYLLVPRGEEAPQHSADVQVINIPLETIVCTSTTHIPHLDYLGVSDKLVGFPSTDYVSSEIVRRRIDAGFVRELGVDNGLNLEVLYSLQPSMVMTYSMTADLGQMKKIQELGIPVVINGEYLEGDALGRAEWIKFTSMFFGKEKSADSVFSIIEKEYNDTMSKVKNVEQRPSVLLGTVYGDAWFMPGGNNYAAKLLEHSGNHYLWANDSTIGWLEISFESVYDKAKDADLWIVGSFDTYDDLKIADNRYALFAPFRNKRIYNYNARKGAKGGNDFLELGYLRPDLILKDLVKIGHPELLPEHELFFHAPLR